MRWGRGTRIPVSRRRRPEAHRHSRTHRVYKNGQIPNSRSQSRGTFNQLHCHEVISLIAFYQQSARTFLLSNMSSLMPHCREHDKEKRSSRRFWMTTKFLFKTTNKTFRKRITGSVNLVQLLHACKKAEKGQDREQRLDACQMGATRQVRKCSQQLKREQKRDDFQLHPKACSWSCPGVESRTTSWMKKQVCWLEHFAESIQPWTACAEVVRYHGIPLSTKTIIMALSPFFLAS